MFQLFLIGLLTYFGYQIIKVIVEALNNKNEENSKLNKQRESEYSLWLSTEEPKYRFLHVYPPDWHFRKIYAQRACSYTCQSCGKTRYHDKKKEKAKRTQWHTFWTGLHVHHIIPISKGGDNSLSNLTCLCETCHENQHKHMLINKLNFYRGKLKRARGGQMKNRWNLEVQALEQRLSNHVNDVANETFQVIFRPGMQKAQSSIDVFPAKQDEYLKETFDLNDSDLNALEVGTFSLPDNFQNVENNEKLSQNSARNQRKTSYFDSEIRMDNYSVNLRPKKIKIGMQMDLSKYKTVGEFYEDSKKLGYNVPLQLCHAVKIKMETENLSFQDAFNFFQSEGKIIRRGKVFLFDMTAYPQKF